MLNLERRLRHLRRAAIHWFWTILLALPRGIVWLFSATGHTIARWWDHRHFRYLLRGLPSLIVAGVCVFFIVAVAIQPPGVLAETYASAARNAMAGGQFGTAKLLYRRLIELRAAENKTRDRADKSGGDLMQLADKETLFLLASAAEKTNDGPMLAGIMADLAPDDRPVHFEAHVWQADRHFRNSASSAEDLRLTETHLKHALALRPDDADTHAMLGEVYFRMGFFPEVIHHLSGVAKDHPARRLTLAKAYAITGNVEQGKYWGEQARTQYERLLAADPRDLEARMHLADTLMFLGRNEEFRESDRVLREGLVLHRDDPASIQPLQAGLARVYAVWSDSLSDTNDPDKQKRFELLSAGLLLNPNDFVLYDRVMRLLKPDDETSEQVREFLRDNIAHGRALAVSHLLLGSVALESSQTEQAGFHLERAFEASPNAPVIANNLAWYLVQVEPPQPERALELIDRVVAQLPGDPRVRDTRGQVLLKLGRFQEAITELEAALPSHVSDPQTHRALAEAYRALGNVPLAESHEKIAASLSRQTP